MSNIIPFEKTLEVFAQVIKDATGIIIDPLKRISTSIADRYLEKQRVIASLEIQKIDVLNRAKLRIYETEIQRQFNIESICNEAMNNLNPESKPEELNRDWLSFFFQNCADITEEEMKVLWSKILSTETNSKNSFSRFTLEKVKLLQSSDCKLFEKLCSKMFIINDMTILPRFENNNFTDNYGLSYKEFISLCDLGLINNSEIAHLKIYASEIFSISSVSNNNKFYLQNSKNESVTFNFYLLTTAGNELIKILSKEFDFNFLRRFTFVNQNFILLENDEVIKIEAKRDALKKLRSLNHNSIFENDAFNEAPSCIRQKMETFTDIDDFYSKQYVYPQSNQPIINTINDFLDGRKPD